MFPFASNRIGQLNPADIMAHFLGAKWETEPKVQVNAGLLALDFDQVATEQLYHSLFEFSSVIQYFGKDFGGYHLGTPNVHDGLEKAQFIVRDLMKRDREYQYRLEKIHFKFEKVGATSWW